MQGDNAPLSKIIDPGNAIFGRGMKKGAIPKAQNCHCESQFIGAKQSRNPLNIKGLLRHFVPRNDQQIGFWDSPLQRKV